MYHYFSLHKIANEKQLPFNAAQYSKFKFGDAESTNQFSLELATAFIEQNKTFLLQNTDIVFLPSPFNHIPTASYHLSQLFKQEVNRFLFQHQKKSLLESKIHRYKTYSQDYGNLNFEERLNLISSDTYHIDTKFLTNRLCIFIDDIKITGSHEMIIKKIIQQNNIEGEFMFVYFAELTNKNIAPTFENYLNYYFVKGNTEIIDILNSKNVKYNTRCIKYILNEQNPIKSLILEVQNSTLQTIVDFAIGNNYHLMEEYKNNLNLIIKHINYGN